MKTIDLVLGGAPLGGLYAPVSDIDAEETLETAWHCGIRDFDTAPHYGLGLSESRLGRFLGDLPRESFRVTTKVGRLLVPADSFDDGAEGYFGTPHLRRVRDYSASGVRRSLEDSLRRLRINHVDQVLIHDPDDYWQPALDEAYPELARMRDEGLVARIGVGMNQTALLERFIAETDLDCVLVAGRYTLLDRQGEQLLASCLARGVSVLAAGVFNSGVLTGVSDRFDYGAAPKSVLQQVARLQSLCASHGVPLAATALQFPRRHPAVTAVVVGARSADEIRMNVQHWSIDIPGELWRDLAAADAKRQPCSSRPGPTEADGAAHS